MHFLGISILPNFDCLWRLVHAELTSILFLNSSFSFSNFSIFSSSFFACALRAQENDALKTQAKKDKEKIEKLENENKQLRNDLDVSSSKKLLPDSGIEESKFGKKEAQKLYNLSTFILAAFRDMSCVS